MSKASSAALLRFMETWTWAIIVMPGAFQKTLQDRGGEMPILFAHDLKQPIGLGKLMDTPAGLSIQGQSVLDVSRAKEAYSLMKAKVLRGLSIGYDSVKSDIVNGARRLLEVKLFEVSLVTIPMNELATVSAVKSSDADLGPQIRQFQELLIAARKSFH
jgi:HK97 family phage prohead protease